MHHQGLDVVGAGYDQGLDMARVGYTRVGYSRRFSLIGGVVRHCRGFGMAWG